MSDCKGCQNDLHTNQPTIQQQQQQNLQHSLHNLPWQEMRNFFFYRLLVLVHFFIASSSIWSLFFRLIWMVEWSLDYFHKYFDYLNTIVFNMPMTNVVATTAQMNNNKTYYEHEKIGIFLSLFVLRFVKILTNDSNMSHLLDLMNVDILHFLH